MAMKYVLFLQHHEMVVYDKRPRPHERKEEEANNVAVVSRVDLMSFTPFLFDSLHLITPTASQRKRLPSFSP